MGGARCQDCSVIHGHCSDNCAVGFFEDAVLAHGKVLKIRSMRTSCVYDACGRSRPRNAPCDSFEVALVF